MKAFKNIFLSMVITMSTGCSQFLTHRDYLAEMEHDDSTFYNPYQDFQVIAGDTGRTWETAAERRMRTPASAREMDEESERYFLLQELKQLESNQSEGARDFYLRYRHKLVSTSEKIYFLKLPVYERKEYLDSRGFLEPQAVPFQAEEQRYAVQQSHIILGMSKTDVMNNLGKPVRVEVAGNPSFENERWLYNIQGASKYIYFESGRVGGWE